MYIHKYIYFLFSKVDFAKKKKNHTLRYNILKQKEKKERIL